MRPAAAIVRAVRRLALFAVAAFVLAVVAIQFESIVAKNVAMARALEATDAEIAALSARERDQRATIARLHDPRGAIPEIHEKMRLVGPNEEMIFVRGDRPKPVRYAP